MPLQNPLFSDKITPRFCSCPFAACSPLQSRSVASKFQVCFFSAAGRYLSIKFDFATYFAATNICSCNSGILTATANDDSLHRSLHLNSEPYSFGVSLSAGQSIRSALAVLLWTHPFGWSVHSALAVLLWSPFG